ncbi:MAG: acetate/propionate family kinase [Marivivens sp.]|jgi:acetate kinase|uniref:acetate/propionate family kinase n=1 Tax=Marivivens sp. TaxID=1978374 RepID=UPI00201F5F34|nr:acetate/propionate family kinase [Marivivens sp.]MCL7404923.1 acetate/propionate family kinase [Marivivens geojensis]NBQ49782.1 acetate/propionate family kinase [Marivivens sp.]NBT50666.1 acetate/propionate family kinase [Marivivens sp.]NBX09176.1 acetate/propionate family kinase [Marivivens sp.]NCW68034.1 acetate/propionate family kinase [Marivivens sp.]
MTTVLTLNAGSSSLKFAVYSSDSDHPMVTGLVDRIGANATLKLKDQRGFDLPTKTDGLSTHQEALTTVLSAIEPELDGKTIDVVGHRVVHGGLWYDAPVQVTDEVIERLTTLEPFAPLHQPHNLSGIKAAKAAFPNAPQIACFDTAFHRHHPYVNDTFAIPRAYYDKGVRRYGFHGLSYDYISGELRRIAPAIAQGRVVVAHLGNGASMCAIQDGKSVASTMGFSALDGLPMGTRCGQLDAGVVLYLMDQEGLSATDISDMLYKKSGLLGLSDLSNDMRTLEASDSIEARQAIDYFVFRIQRELGGMAAAMGGIDALVFCGGIGENSAFIRDRVCERTAWMGIEIDHNKNDDHAQVISTEMSRTTVMVIPTNEELVIARAARELTGV